MKVFFFIVYHLLKVRQPLKSYCSWTHFNGGVLSIHSVYTRDTLVSGHNFGFSGVFEPHWPPCKCQRGHRGWKLIPILKCFKVEVQQMTADLEVVLLCSKDANSFFLKGTTRLQWWWTTVGQLVRNLEPDWNISTAFQMIAMTFLTDMSCWLQWSHDFSSPLAGQSFH